MPIDKDPTTDPEFIERQYRAGNDPTARYNINVELAQAGTFSQRALFGAPLFGYGADSWGFVDNPLAPFIPPGRDPGDVFEF